MFNLDKAERQFVKESFLRMKQLRENMDRIIIGQSKLKEAFLWAVLSDGHILIEAQPGTGKTLAVKAFARCIDAPYSRIQFTPDTTPTELLRIYEETEDPNKSRSRPGPLVTGTVVHADELNRTPPRVQSALLQAMQEKKVTYGDEEFTLGTDDLYFVAAVQNEIEREGTYFLSEACMERFLVKITGLRPSNKELRKITALSEDFERHLAQIKPVFKPKELVELRVLIEKRYPELKDPDSLVISYITRLVEASLKIAPKKKNKREKDKNVLIEYGISARGSIHLKAAARVYAFLRGMDTVLPEHIKAVARPVLRGKFNLAPQVDKKARDYDDIVKQLLDTVPVEEKLWLKK